MPLSERAWLAYADDGAPCVAVGSPESIRHSLIPPDAARERARDLRAWLPQQTMGHGQHRELLDLADQLEQAADECEAGSAT